MRAKLLGKLNGRRVYWYPVRVEFGERASLGLDGFETEKTTVYVISDSARAARDLVADPLRTIPCVTVEVIGPQGGIAAKAWWSWESAIGAQMFDSRPETTQLEIAL